MGLYPSAPLHSEQALTHKPRPWLAPARLVCMSPDSYTVLHTDGSRASYVCTTRGRCLEACSLGGGGATRRITCPARGRGLVLGTEGLAGLPRQVRSIVFYTKP